MFFLKMQYRYAPNHPDKWWNGMVWTDTIFYGYSFRRLQMKKTDAGNCLKKEPVSTKMLKNKIICSWKSNNNKKTDCIELKTFILLSRETQRQRESRPLKIEAALHKKWRQNKLTSEGKWGKQNFTKVFMSVIYRDAQNIKVTVCIFFPFIVNYQTSV